MEETQTRKNDLVCDACWNGIFSVSGWQAVLAAKPIPEAPRTKGYSYKTTWEDIRASADHCTWCRFLSRPNPKGEVEVRAACDEESDCTPAGEKMLRINLVGKVLMESRYYMYTRENDNAARFVAARERVRDLTSPKSYHMALQLFDNCVKTHTKCPKPQEDTVFPDRVIDCTDTRKPKLVLTRGQRGCYIALSYVWGASQSMMTTTKNVEKYCTEGLDMALFPQTIQDAVIVTHNLGERYLWIDAQCILQDSDADKARQLGMMCAIYRHSYLTISAACADAASQGFLQRARAEKIPNARIPYRCPDGTIGTVWIARQMDTDVPDVSHSYWDELEPLTYRGWCMQERMLPPRSLIYASDTLKYYCQTETANIGGALCEPSTGMRLPNAIYHGSQDAPLSDAQRKTYRQAWLAALFVYTLRAITVPTDKLVAMAGLAEQFQRVYHDEYLAGLWRKTLLFDLMWSTETGMGNPRPKVYRAPSWSWAAVDGLISAPYREESSNTDLLLAEIIHCRVTLKDPSLPFGEVTAGLLKLKGYLKEVTLGGGSVRAGLGEGREPVQIGSIRHDAEDDKPETGYVIPLLWSARPVSVEGLVVVKANDQQYRRVGWFYLGSYSKDVKWLDGLIQHEITIV